MTSESNPSGTIKSDQTLFSIIEFFQQNRTAGVTELAEALNMSKSTIHKHLKTLNQAGYVSKNEEEYKLSFKFLTIGGNVRDKNSLCNHVQSSIKNIVTETDHVVSFTFREGAYGVFVFIRNDNYGIYKILPLGNRFRLHQNGSGKAILAELDDEEINEYIDQVGLPAATSNTITDGPELWEEIRKVQEQGYATSSEERIEGAQSVAAAVKNHNSGNIGAITIGGPADDMTQERIHTDYAETLIKEANDLELKMRFTEH
jgi:DNA-binding IclR family transcriptional regulator